MELPVELVQSTVELALMQPLSQAQLIRGCWLRSLLASSLVCSAWRDAVRSLCATLDVTAGLCTPGCLEPWTARGWLPAQFWLWQLEMHRRRLNEARLRDGLPMRIRSKRPAARERRLPGTQNVFT